MDLFGTNNKNEVLESIQNVKNAKTAGVQPNREDLDRVQTAAKQAGETGRRAQEALGIKY